MPRPFTPHDHVRLIWQRPCRWGKDGFTFDDGLPPPTDAEFAATEAQAKTLFAQEQAPVKTWATVAEFNAEFTPDEKKAIIRASRQNDDLALLDRELLSWRSEVWASDPRILEGLDALVTARILTTQRRSEILSP
jgi:hypothetical protein